MSGEWIILTVGLVTLLAFTVGAIVGHQRPTTRWPYEYQIILAQMEEARRQEEAHREQGCSATLFLIIVVFALFIALSLH